MTEEDIKNESIDFIIDVIGQYGYFNEKKQAYYTGGYSTQEWAFDLLYKWGVIENPGWVKLSELNKWRERNLQSGFKE